MSIFSKTTFLFLNKLTLFSLFILILAGGIVRSTGSGMGCPDWPKCFDRYIPPTSIDQLPFNYQQIYSERGYESTEFNVAKTWTEYINRLIGAITGFILFLALLSSLQFRKTSPTLFYLVLGSFLLTGFQAWLGGRVVASNLHALMITAHMFVALIILGILLYTYIFSKYNEFSIQHLKLSKSLGFLLILCLMLTVLQIGLGTQVREAIDHISKLMNLEERGSWVEQVGLQFYVHRSSSILILLLNSYLIFNAKSAFKSPSLFSNLLFINGILILAQIISGIVLSYLALPPTFQAIHLFLATLLFGAQLSLVCLYFKNPKTSLSFQN